MKSILISIKPNWVAKILNGEKTVEVRKGTALYKATQKLIDEYGYAEFFVYNTRDERYRLDKELNGKYFVWDTKSKDYPFDKTRNRHYFFGKVVFKFRCYKVEHFEREYLSRYIDDYYYDSGEPLNKKFYKQTCLTEDELFNYIGGKGGCAIHISDLEIFDKPKELSEFNGYKRVHKCDVCPIERMCIGFCGKDTYSTILKPLTKAPQSMCYIEVEK